MPESALYPGAADGGNGAGKQGHDHALLGGFTCYSQLRLRDHRPGIGDYELPSGFGPKSDSLKKSILGRRHLPSTTEGCNIGPGDYAIPTTIGTGRATQFGPPIVKTEGEPPAATRETKTPVTSAAPASFPTPKQYSMACYPDTPSYSLYGRLKTEWEAQTGYETPGPAAYNVPGIFDHIRSADGQPPRGIVPGVHLGMRTAIPGGTAGGGVPGPGTYDLRRFGDEVPRKGEPILGHSHRRRKLRECDTPGPGAYDDPTSIGYRATKEKNRLRLTKASTFGGRWQRKAYETAGPGPAAYETAQIKKDLYERHQRHPPRFVRPHPPITKATRGSLDGDRVTDGPLPSDFDYDYRKGKTMLGRWGVPKPQMSLVGPGSYDISAATAPQPSGGRWTAAPFDPASLRQEEAKDANRKQRMANAGGHSGPGAYTVSYDAVDPQLPAARFGAARSAKFASAENGVPGPGHYHLNDALYSNDNGHVFYKGDFHPRSDAGGSLGGGPGAHYNDGTMYSRSINGDGVNNKGFTMGIRYPARATYQYCKPYDETTNINCVYPHELTWETKVNVLPAIKTRTATKTHTTTTTA